MFFEHLHGPLAAALPASAPESPRARCVQRHALSALLACGAVVCAGPASATALASWGTWQAAAAAVPTAAATTTTMTTAQVQLDVTGIDSFTTFRGAGNFVTFLQVAPFAHVTAIDFDVNLSAFDPSMLSGLAVIFTDSGITAGVSSRPGFGTDTPGTQSFVGGGDLIAQGLDFFVGSDGRLRLEFVETLDDASVSPDGRWNAGSLRFTVSAVPEPGAFGLMAVGALGLAWQQLRPRRR